MALVKTSAFITDIVGKVNGSVFQRNASGLILRNSPGIINKNSQAQQPLKQIALQLQQVWGDLSVQQLNAWHNYGVLRNVSTRKSQLAKLSGHQIFLKEGWIRLNMIESVSNMAPQLYTTPIFTSPPQASILVAIVNTGATLDVITFDAIDHNNEYLIISMSRPLRNSQLSNYIKKRVIQFQQVDGDTQNIKTAYEKIYGTSPAIGEWINFSIAHGKFSTQWISNVFKGRMQVQ